MPDNRTSLNDVLFTLYAAEDLAWPSLNRTGFQKILYLCAVLAPIAGLNWDYSFTNAVYGPFNKDIHLAPDLLTIRYNFAEVTNFTLTSDSKLRAEYKITTRGYSEVNQIAKLHIEKYRLNWISLVMKVLDIYGIKMIAKLAVYEPTYFLTHRKRQKFIDLSSDQNLSLRLLHTLETELRTNYSIDLDTMISKMIMYFDFLSSDIGRGVKQ